MSFLSPILLWPYITKWLINDRKKKISKSCRPIDHSQICRCSRVNAAVGLMNAHSSFNVCSVQYQMIRGWYHSAVAKLNTAFAFMTADRTSCLCFHASLEWTASVETTSCDQVTQHPEKTRENGLVMDTDTGVIILRGTGLSSPTELNKNILFYASAVRSGNRKEMQATGRDLSLWRCLHEGN